MFANLKTVLAGTLGAITLLSSTAFGAFQTPSENLNFDNGGDSWNRGDAYTSYYEWSLFSTAVGSNAPTASNSTAVGVASLVQKNGLGNFPAGIQSNGIYAHAGRMDIDVTIPSFALAGATSTDIIVQALWSRGAGDTVNPTVSLNGVAPILVVRGDGTVQGNPVTEYFFKWNDVPGNAASYTVNVLSTVNFTFLGSLAVDVRAVPEPGALGAIGVAALTVLRRHRRA